MTDWRPPVIHQGIDFDQAEQMAKAETLMADSLAAAKIRHDQRCRDSRTDYETDVAAIEAAHRATMTRLWLERQFKAIGQRADQEGM